MAIYPHTSASSVSIQPKPKKGLEEEPTEIILDSKKVVSIQPKPKKGLEVVFNLIFNSLIKRFNPAEAEEGFRRYYIF